MHPPRIILGIAAALAPRQAIVTLAFLPPRTFHIGATTSRSASATTSSTAAAAATAAGKEICETTITDQGKAEVLCNTSNEDERSSLWSDVAIHAAKQFTITQRKKLKELGALDIERPVQIVGEPVTDNCGLGDCVVHHDDDTINPKSSSSSKNTKIIHFQRHGQGYHNLICDMWRELERPIDFDSLDPNLNPVVRPEFLDPPLTALGMQQCKSQRDLCASLSPELVIVSPMLRCLQTAKLSFRDHVVTNVPWVSHEGCREELGLLMGNKRRSIEDIKADYPEIDFSDIEHDEDVLWEEYGERRETLLEKSERIYEFLTEYVRHRPEREISIVCHSAYLFTLMNAVMDISDEELRSWFLTSEVRSLQMTFIEREHE
eukprot:CAMPEP_0202015638 /NCGR_PEP_ID=MMETSP0905-20130828/32479_1 /ASSEMBLY_ACC=CAM_ASM_000554 /TAXON_ID=420261 /ORGANISM="Thalassiosira antarctica, Strain CCMP982" /LENGTH=375 /DNA_ID=CAMNT_0048575837 /DNA_START=1 /DNA_END=1128 /DNA_ORIENTATION=-